MPSISRLSNLAALSERDFKELYRRRYVSQEHAKRLRSRTRGCRVRCLDLLGEVLYRHCRPFGELKHTGPGLVNRSRGGMERQCCNMSQSGIPACCGTVMSRTELTVFDLDASRLMHAGSRTMCVCQHQVMDRNGSKSDWPLPALWPFRHLTDPDGISRSCQSLDHPFSPALPASSWASLYHRIACPVS